MFYRTAPPAGVAGYPAAQRCRSRRGLALRVVPLAFELDERALRRAYLDDGRAGLAWAVRAELFDVVRNRAESADERRVLVAWWRYALPELTAAWLGYAEAAWSRCEAR